MGVGDRRHRHSTLMTPDIKGRWALLRLTRSGPGLLSPSDVLKNLLQSYPIGTQLNGPVHVLLCLYEVSYYYRLWAAPNKHNMASDSWATVIPALGPGGSTGLRQALGFLERLLKG